MDELGSWLVTVFVREVSAISWLLRLWCCASLRGNACTPVRGVAPGMEEDCVTTLASFLDPRLTGGAEMRYLELKATT